MKYKSINFCVLSLALFLAFPTLKASADKNLPLPQRAMLGLAPTTTQTNQPVTVQRTLPGSTAARLGLQQNDQLISINKRPIKDFSGLINEIQRISVGAKMEVVVERQGKKMSLSGIMSGRPRETSELAEVSYDTLHWQNQRIRTIKHTPKSVTKNNKKAPAIFYLQGYTCDSIDYGGTPEITMLQMLNQFVKAGYIVYRAEKLGVGESDGTLDCLEIDFKTESAAFTGALRVLKADQNVDADKVFLWGHSLGVLSAPAIAKQEPVAGIIGYGGVLKPWFDYMIDVYQRQSVQYFDSDEATAKQNLEIIRPFLVDWLKSDKDWEQLLQNKQAVESSLLPIDGQRVFSRHYTFFRNLNQYNFATMWQELEIPTLMIHGSLDIQAIDSSWAFDIADAVNRGKKTLGKAVVIDGAEHGLMRYKDIAEYVAARANNQYNPGRPEDKFEPRIGEATLSWIEKVLHSQSL